MTGRKKIFFLAAALLCACAGGNKDLTKPITGPAASDAGRAYAKGVQELKDKNYLEATRFFEAVRNNYPYSQFAALADLAIADINFERDDYGGPAVPLQRLVKGHPPH